MKGKRIPGEKKSLSKLDIIVKFHNKRLCKKKFPIKINGLP